jgi:hypothetical protein
LPGVLTGDAAHQEQALLAQARKEAQSNVFIVEGLGYFAPENKN